MNKRLTAQEALARLEELCARSEQCSYEVEQKMFRWGVDASSRAAVLDSLIAGRFVDDERYARAYVRSKFRFNRWGRRKIAVGLAAKRIPRSVAASAMHEEIAPEEYEAVLVSLLRSRARGMERPLDYENRSRLGRFAMQRGFEWSAIEKAMAKISETGDDEETY